MFIQDQIVFGFLYGSYDVIRFFIQISLIGHLVQMIIMTIYSRKYARKLEENRRDLRNQVIRGERYERIRSFANKYGLDQIVIKRKILSDDIFALTFVKDPVQQNVYMECAIEHLKSLNLVRNFKHLSRSYHHYKFVRDGVVSSIRFDDSTKLDFEWDTKKNKVYAMHTFSNNSGGNQNNKLKKVKEFLENCEGNNDSIFILICDGTFYAGKISKIRSKYETDKVKILHLDELNSYLSSLK